MLIDPFVVIAQIINFLILVALLKRFLYQPITQAMEVRSQRIERQLATAAAKEQDAETEKALYQQKQQELTAQKQAWLEQAQQEVVQEKARLTQQAKAEVELARSQWDEMWQQDRQKFTRELRDRLTQQVALSSRKALADLANSDLESQIIATFIARLSNIESSQTNKLNAAPFAEPQSPVVICSSFPISQQSRERLIAAVQQLITLDQEVRFDIEQDLICGIELRYGGYKISWNIEHYLTELETATAKFLSEYNNQGS